MKITSFLLAAILLCSGVSVFAQHSAQIDDGVGHYSIIRGSTSGGTYTLGNGGGTIMSTGGAALTQGSVVFVGAGGVLAQDNANFFWDNTNKILSLGTAGTASLNPADTRFHLQNAATAAGWDFGITQAAGNGEPGHLYIESNWDQMHIYLDADNNVGANNEDFTIFRGASHTGAPTQILKVDGNGNVSAKGSVSIGGGNPITIVIIAEAVGGYTVPAGGDFSTAIGPVLGTLDMRDQVTWTWSDPTFINSQCIWSAHVINANTIRVNIHNFGGAAATIPPGTLNRVTVTRFN